MDNSITARFFHIDTIDRSAGSFEEILLDIFSYPVAQRERNIGAEAGDNIIARLERLTDDGDFVFGEFVRRQTDNKPPEANEDGLKPLTLANGGGLGHASAFRYHRPTNIFCLQNNPSGLSINRVQTYLSAWCPRSRFTIERVPTDDALERFRRGETRAFEVEIASPINLPAIEGDAGAADKTVVEATRMLATAFEGMTVTIQVSMGRRTGELPDDPIEKAINRLLPWKRGGNADVRKLRVKSKPATGEGDAEYISFLDEFLQERTRTTLPDDDPDRNYGLRRDTVSLWFNQHLPYLRRLYQR